MNNIACDPFVEQCYYVDNGIFLGCNAVCYDLDIFKKNNITYIVQIGQNNFKEYLEDYNVIKLNVPEKCNDISIFFDDFINFMEKIIKMATETH